MSIESKVLNNHTIEFLPEQHIYVVDGIVTPCVSDILSFKFNDYKGVSRAVLNHSAELGTAMHKAIELYETQGLESDLIEVRNYLFIKKHFKFENIANELPVCYEQDGRVKYAGTLDQVLKIDGQWGINDFKRVSAPNKDKIAYQLNFYKLAFEQCYGQHIDFLSFTHLREDVRKFHYMPVNEEIALELLKEYEEAQNDDI